MPDTVEARDTFRVQVRVRNADDDLLPVSLVSWSSSDSTVVSVDSTGLFHARAAGSVLVTARAGDVSAQTSVLVQAVRWVDVVASYYDVCALSDRRRLYCAHMIIDGLAEKLSEELPGTGFQSITAGYHVVCALTVQGDAYCRGIGALGNEKTDQSGQLLPVSGGHTFRRISGGTGLTVCALDASGAAYCWGPTYGTTPQPIPGGHAFTEIAAGDGDASNRAFACALDADGRAWCWGAGDRGELGTISGLVDCGGYLCSPTPVPVATDLRFRSITAGGTSYACGLASTGQAYCWGDNGWNQLGAAIKGELCNGTCTAVPTAVAGGHSFTEIHAADVNTCGLSRTFVLCWGYGDFLWGNDAAGSATPTGVMDLRGRFLGVSALEACLVRLDFTTLSCWGANSRGYVFRLD